MKRVRIATGKHVVISPELAAKAVRVFATSLTREQVLDLMATEPRHAAGLMAGSKKPLALSKPRGGSLTADAQSRQSGTEKRGGRR